MCKINYLRLIICKQPSEKTEEEIMNRQSRDPGNIGDKTQIKDKQNN